MADLHTTNLCAEIISTHFGPLASKVASILLSRGRLTLPQLARFTSLKPRLVRNILLVLIQQNIVWHANSETDGSGEEVLEFNVEECLMRLHFGAFVYQAEELFGVAGGEIIQLVLDHGKLTSPRILQSLNAAATSFLPSEDKTPVVYSQALYKLVSLRYLKPSTVSSHISPRDKRIQYEAEEKAKISGFPTSKQLREAKETVDARFKMEEAETEKIGLKRKAKSQLPSTKKRKATSTKEDDGTVVDTVYFRVNFDKFNIHTRNALIEKAVQERYNPGAALVVRAILKITEETQHSVADIRSDPLSVSNIILHLNSEEDEETLTSGLIQSSSSKSKSAGSCVKEYLGILSSADNPTPTGRAGAFLEFSSKGKGGGSGKVQVLFDIVARRLKRQVLEGVARERHGLEGVRVIRLLMDTGKLDEKQISKNVMMPLKDVRPLLSALSASSLVSIIEVPKSADRNPTRMFYLWQVDIPKAFSHILNVLYKTLYNISARRQAEREDPTLVAVLNKRERSDVSVDVEGLLSQHEKEVLKAWEEKEQKLSILEGRVEESVFIVRELGRAVGSLED
ncbi:RNA polymerase III subunit RPC82 helix-turn-helix domain-containing protein [Lentinula detonsa]|uniref:DNA-directed RNA polymerase III subunit RPC3 n=1 Tax=Lentinula detonsa TaxID=2804962 RepID=A0A9W8TV65_9AGAR|nr:RNA polymerase III subunit RPC82 helix-turn-helix domain-containing protein [Lentinula detonsa]